MRIVDDNLLDYFRSRPRCEYCGHASPGRLDPNHVYARGIGGGSRLDVVLNLVALCPGWTGGQCHDKYHNGRISRAELWRIIETREGLEEGQAEAAVHRLLRTPKERRA